MEPDAGAFYLKGAIYDALCQLKADEVISPETEILSMDGYTEPDFVFSDDTRKLRWDIYSGADSFDTPEDLTQLVWRKAPKNSLDTMTVLVSAENPHGYMERDIRRLFDAIVIVGTEVSWDKIPMVISMLYDELKRIIQSAPELEGVKARARMRYSKYCWLCGLVLREDMNPVRIPNLKISFHKYCWQKDVVPEWVKPDSQGIDTG